MEAAVEVEIVRLCAVYVPAGGEKRAHEVGGGVIV